MKEDLKKNLHKRTHEYMDDIKKLHGTQNDVIRDDVKMIKKGRSNEGEDLVWLKNGRRERGNGERGKRTCRCEG